MKTETMSVKVRRLKVGNSGSTARWYKPLLAEGSFIIVVCVDV